MKDFQIVIPTFERPRRQLTLSNLPASVQEDTLLVCSTEHDARIIRKVYKHDNIIVATKPTCIAEKRHWIMKHVKAHHIFMMDDDMYFMCRIPEKYRYWRSEGTNNRWIKKDGTPGDQRGTLRKATDEQLVAAFDTVRKKFHHGYAGLCISSRMLNDCVHEEWRKATRMMHAFGINRDLYLKLGLRFSDVYCREDFHITLELLKHGYRTATWYGTCCSPADYNFAGGCSSERSMERSNHEAKRLAKLHPGLVRIVEKKYIHSVPRLEVVVQWKKAYELGKAKREGAK